MRTKEHDGKIAGHTIEGRQMRRQGTHVRTVKPKPWQLRTLNRPGTSDLTGTDIYRQHFSGRTYLLGEIEGRNAVAGSDVKDPQAWSKVQVL